MSELINNSEEVIEAKVSIRRNVLLKALEELKNVVSKKNTTIPITQNVHVQIFGTKIIWAATNMSVSLRKITEDGIDIQGTAEFTVEPNLMYQTVNSINTNEEVVLEKAYATLHMTILRNRFKFPVSSANDFPVFPDIEDPETQINIPIPRLKEILKNTRTALGNEAIENAFSGIKFQPKEDRIQFVSTNKHKLYYLEETNSELDETDNASEVIFPKNLIDFVLNISSGVDATITYGSLRSSNHIRISYNNNVAMIRKITGKYPDINFITNQLKKENYITIDLLKSNLKNVLGIASKYSDNGEAIFNIKSQEKGIEIKTSSFLENASNLILTSEHMEDNDLADDHEVVLNIKYILEMISAPECSAFRFYFPHNKTRPTIIETIYNEEEDIESIIDEYFLLMPIINLKNR